MSGNLSSGRTGTFFVLEEEPPRRRWYCHWDGADAPGFDSVDDAVAWGLQRARGVVVRTIGTVFYLVGDAPDDRDPGTGYRPWPPSAIERRQIDLDYQAACEATAEEEAVWAAYEAARDAWLSDRRSSGQGSVVHECSIALPGSAEAIWFEEFDAAGERCGVGSRDGRFIFGSAVEVLSSVVGRSPNDAWVRAVVAALERERSWSDNRRSSLDVYIGSGTCQGI